MIHCDCLFFLFLLLSNICLISCDTIPFSAVLGVLQHTAVFLPEFTQEGVDGLLEI